MTSSRLFRCGVLATLLFVAIVARPARGQDLEPFDAPSGVAPLMIELDGIPAAIAWKNAIATGSSHAAAAAQSKTQKALNEKAQQSVLAVLRTIAPDAKVIYRVQSAYNGIAVQADVATIAQFRKLPGVKAVHRMRPVERNNASSVPLIGAPAAWQNFGVHGENIRVGIIDTGIDYTHTDFGGSGSVSDLNAARSAANNPPSATLVPGFTVTNGATVLFPNAKVIGGFDLAGDNYDASSTAASAAPAPDPNPMDCNGHGSHVAGTALGYGVNADGTTFAGPYDNTVPFSTMRIGPGVAPQAQLFSIRVFGCSGSTNLVPQALDLAVDPNGDGNISNHLDVVNMSLGSSYGDPDNPDVAASNNAAAAGIILAVSAGNSGDTYYISGSPGSAAGVITVAASADDTDVSDGFRVDAPPAIAGIYGATRSVNYNWNALSTFTANLYYPTMNQYGCNAWNGSDPNIAGRILLLDWRKPGDAIQKCGSTVRTNFARDAGAVGVIMVDNTTFLATSISGNADIPAMYTISTYGDTLKSQLTAGVVSGVNVTFSVDFHNDAKIVTPGQNDTLGTFSSRGPRSRDSLLKPDIAAPGVGTFSAAFGTGNQGVLESGTSMASPHIAGVMALMRQMHPSWTVEELKAALMNTATQDLFTGLNHTGNMYGPGRVGAGRVKVADAIADNVIAYNADGSGTVSVSFGAVEVLGTLTVDKQITVANKGPTAVTLTLSYIPRTNCPGVTYTFPDGNSVSLDPGQTSTFHVHLSADASLMRYIRDVTVDAQQSGNVRSFLTEASGFVGLDDGAGSVLRVPVHAIVRPASAMSVSETHLTSAAQSTLHLVGTGVNTGSSSTDYISEVTPMELAYVSPMATLGNASPFARNADLKYVGISSERSNTNIMSRLNNTFINFGIATWGDWTRPANEMTFVVSLDTDQNGTDDYILFNTNLTSTDVDATGLRKLLPLGATTFERFINEFDASVPTALYNNSVMFLPVDVNRLNLGTRTRFNYHVDAYNSEWGLIDSTPTLTYDYASPGLDFSGSSNLVMYYSVPGNTIPVVFNPASYYANNSLGVLLLQHFNTSGNRTQIIPGCPQITVANPAVASGTAGVPFSQTFTQMGGEGAITFTIASGSLPTGLSLAANGTLSGTPAQVGSFSITVTATDTHGCSGTGATYTLVISCPTIAVTNPSNSTATTGTAFSEIFTQSGAASATFTLESGSLPAGLGLAPDGTLSGTPTQSGSFPITVRAIDAYGCFGVGATYTLVVGAPPAITNFSPVQGGTNTRVMITGTNFNSTSSVTFNGVAASFVVLSPTSIRAIVPAAASTGPISVTTPSGTFTTSSNFIVVAQVARTFVSTNGLDTNDCTLPHPCRNWSRALGLTLWGGEVIALKSGGYGPVMIDKAVSITAPTGVYAGITANGGEGVTISAAAGDVVTLRGLTINGVGGATYGVSVGAGTSVELDGTVISGFNSAAVHAENAERVHVYESIIRGCQTGLFARTTDGSATFVVIERSRFESGVNGISAGDGARVIVRRTQLAGNQTGVVADPTTTPADVTLERCSITGGTNGLTVGGDGPVVVRLSNCTVTGNTTSISVLTNGSVLSLGNNTIDGATPPVIPAK